MPETPNVYREALQADLDSIELMEATVNTPGWMVIRDKIETYIEQTRSLSDERKCTTRDYLAGEVHGANWILTVIDSHLQRRKELLEKLAESARSSEETHG